MQITLHSKGDRRRRQADTAAAVTLRGTAKNCDATPASPGKTKVPAIISELTRSVTRKWRRSKPIRFARWLMLARQLLTAFSQSHALTHSRAWYLCEHVLRRRRTLVGHAGRRISTDRFPCASAWRSAADSRAGLHTLACSESSN